MYVHHIAKKTPGMELKAFTVIKSIVLIAGSVCAKPHRAILFEPSVLMGAPAPYMQAIRRAKLLKHYEVLNVGSI